jgi:hypothetical protein
MAEKDLLVGSPLAVAVQELCTLLKSPPNQTLSRQDIVPVLRRIQSNVFANHEASASNRSKYALFNNFRQHDATEFMTLLIDNIQGGQCKLSDINSSSADQPLNSRSSLICSLFGGVLSRYKYCEQCKQSFQSAKNVFLSLSIPLPPDQHPSGKHVTAVELSACLSTFTAVLLSPFCYCHICAFRAL